MPTKNKQDKRFRGISYFFCFVLGYFAWHTAYEAWIYILGNPKFFDPAFEKKYTEHLTLVRCHGVAACIALAVGILQFFPQTRRFRFHRHLGRVYVLSVLIASLTALPMGLWAEGGWTTQGSFTVLAILWFATAIVAFSTAKRKQFKQHRIWMIRNYALTFGAVLTRVLQNLFLELGYGFESIYPWTTLSWVVTLLVGEWWINSTKTNAR